MSKIILLLLIRLFLLSNILRHYYYYSSTLWLFLSLAKSIIYSEILKILYFLLLLYLILRHYLGLLFHTVACANGVLSQSHKKSISGDPCMGGWDVVVRFVGIEVEGCPRFLVSHLYPSPCGKNSPFCLHQTQENSQCPEILCHWFSPCQNLVQLAQSLFMVALCLALCWFT